MLNTWTCIRRLRKKYKDLKDSQGYKEVISIGIPYMEIVLYNSVEIRDLFKENNYKGIQFSIEKLRNAAKFASQFFTCLGNITQEDHNLLDTLSESSIFDARSLLDQNYSSLKSMFTELPAFDILKDTVTKIKEGASSKHGRDISFHNKDIRNNNTLSDEESSKTDDETATDEFSHSETENTIGDNNSEVSDEDSSKTDNDTAEDEVSHSENKAKIGDNSSELSDNESSKTDNETAEDEYSNSEN